MAAGDLNLNILIQAQDKASTVAKSVAANMVSVSDKMRAAQQKLEDAQIKAAQSNLKFRDAADKASQAMQKAREVEASGNATTEQLATAKNKASDAIKKMEMAGLKDAEALQKVSHAEENASVAAQRLAESENKASSGGNFLHSVFGKLKESGGHVWATLLSIGKAAAGAALNFVQTYGPQLLDFGKASVKSAGDFEAAMLKVKNLAAPATENIKDMSNALLEMGPIVGKTPQELADGLYGIESSGIHGKQALDLLRESGEVAAIGQVKMSIVTNAATAALNNYSKQGLTAKQAIDTMTKTVSEGNMQYSQYASSVGKLSAVSAQSGIKFNEANAALAIFTRTGENAQIATTHLTSMFQFMSINTAKLQKNAQGMGKQFDVTKFQSMSLAEKMGYLQKITGGNSTAVNKLFGNNKTLTATYLKLLANSKDYSDVLKDLAKSAGMTDAAFAASQDTYNQQMSQMQASFETLKIVLGSALLPVLNSLMKFVTPLVSQFTAWITSSGLAANATSFLSNVGSGLVSVLQGLGTGFTDVVTWTGKLNLGPLGAAFQTLGKSISTNLGPVVATFSQMFNQSGGAQKASADLTAFANGGIKTAIRAIQDLSQWLGQVGKWFRTDVQPALKQALPGFLSLSQSLSTNLVPDLKALLSAGGQVISNVFATLGPIIKQATPYVIELAGFLADKLGKAITYLSPYFQQAVAAIGQFSGEIRDRVLPIASRFFEELHKNMPALQAIWNALWPSLSASLRGAWDIIVGVVKVAWALLSGMIKIGLDLLSGNWKQAWTDFKDMLKGVWDGIVSILRGGMRMLLAAIRPLFDVLAQVPGPVGDMARKVQATFNALDKSMDSSSASAKTHVTTHVTHMRTITLQQVQQMHLQAAASLDQMRQKIVTAMQNTSDPVKLHALQMKLAVVQHMEDMQKQSAQQAANMASTVTGHARAMQDQMVGHSIVPDMVNSIVSWFARLPGQAASALSGLTGKVGGIFTGLASQAASWGSNLVQNFINGLSSMIGNVANAAGNIMKAVSDHLKPGSPTKKGIGRTLMEWGPNIVKHVAQGMVAATPVLHAAVAHVTGALTPLAHAQTAIAHATGHHHKGHGGSGHHHKKPTPPVHTYKPIAPPQMSGKPDTALEKQDKNMVNWLNGQIKQMGGKHGKRTHQQVVLDEARMKALKKALSQYKNAIALIDSKHATLHGPGSGSTGSSGGGTSSGGGVSYGGSSGGGTTYNITLNTTINVARIDHLDKQQAQNFADQIDAILLQKLKRSGVLSTVSSGGTS